MEKLQNNNTLNQNKIKKNISKRTSKYLCKLKANKLSAQPVKLAVSALRLWQLLSKTNFGQVQYLNLYKYNKIRVRVSDLSTGSEVSVNLGEKKLHTSNLNNLQEWITVFKNHLILVNTQKNQVFVFNIKKIKCINLLTSRTNKSARLLSKSYINFTKTFVMEKYFQKSVIIAGLKKKKYKLFRKRVTKFSKKWFKLEYKKYKKFKNKYDGRDIIGKKTPIRSITKLKPAQLKNQIYRKYSNKLTFIKAILVEEKARKTRIKELFKSLTTPPKKKRKNKKKVRIKYFNLRFFQHRVKSYNKVAKTIYVELGNSFLKKPVSKSHTSKKLGKKIKINKIKLLQRLLFNPSKKNRKKISKYQAKTKKLKTVLKKINKQIKYKLKWFSYYEYKSFRWKFQKKRWYFTMSKWKRLAEFRRMLRSAWRNHRKLQKNFLFIKLLRANFKHILGIQESELLKKWIKIRRGTNLNNTISSVDYLNQALQLKLDGLAMFLGVVPNRLMAQELVHFGGLRVNGLIITNENFSLHQNDMLQIDIKVIQDIRSLYKDAHWNSVRTRLKFTSFLQVQWSIMLFMLVRWPQNYELLEESILNQRWVRFFIRYFPVRISKYKKAKVKWYKY
jgi:hypothetical protein